MSPMLPDKSVESPVLQPLSRAQPSPSDPGPSVKSSWAQPPPQGPSWNPLGDSQCQSYMETCEKLRKGVVSLELYLRHLGAQLTPCVPGASQSPQEPNSLP